MRNAVTNPFEPGSDNVPPIWAGRTAQINDWRTKIRPRRTRGLYETGRTILGEPGLGKSALVRRIAREAREGGDWVTDQLRIPLKGDPLKIVADALLKLAQDAGISSKAGKGIADLLGRVRQVAASGVSLTVAGYEGPEPHSALSQLLIEIGTAATRQHRVALIHVDEVQNITDEAALSQLLIALGDALIQEVEVDIPGVGPRPRYLPIMVYLTGLPDFEDRAGALKGATFARRFTTELLTPIDDADVKLGLDDLVTEGWETPSDDGAIEVVRLADDAKDAIAELSRGEPFLFQLAGERAWNAGDGPVITLADVRAGWASAIPQATTHVERILARLPERERAFLDAMAGLEPDQRTLTAIATAAGFAKSSDAGPTSQRLERVRGIIRRRPSPYTFAHRAIEAFLTTDWPDLP